MSGVWILIILILISSLPVFAAFIWFRIAKYQIPAVQFFLVLLAGATAIFPALVLQDLLGAAPAMRGRGLLFYEFFIRIALTEEISRLLMLFIFFWISGIIKPNENINKQPTFNSVHRGTAIGLVAGLGFALLESAVFGVLNANIMLIRAFTAAPLHAACGSRIGAAAVLFPTNPIQAIMRIITATAIHGVYNLMIYIPNIPSIAAILIAFSALASAILSIHNGRAIDKSNNTAIDKTKDN